MCRLHVSNSRLTSYLIHFLIALSLSIPLSTTIDVTLSVKIPGVSSFFYNDCCGSESSLSSFVPLSPDILMSLSVLASGDSCDSLLGRENIDRNRIGIELNEREMLPKLDKSTTACISSLKCQRTLFLIFSTKTRRAVKICNSKPHLKP